MALSMIIKKKDGQSTRPMSQREAETYLINLVNKNEHANFKQAMNQAFNDQGKPSGPYKEAGQDILHASSGNGQKSVTLFYYSVGPTITLVAMGEHATSTSYKISTYGQPSGSFTQGATIRLS